MCKKTIYQKNTLSIYKYLKQNEINNKTIQYILFCNMKRHQQLIESSNKNSRFVYISEHPSYHQSIKPILQKIKKKTYNAHQLINVIIEQLGRISCSNFYSPKIKTKEMLIQNKYQNKNLGMQSQSINKDIPQTRNFYQLNQQNINSNLNADQRLRQYISQNESQSQSQRPGMNLKKHSNREPSNVLLSQYSQEVCDIFSELASIILLMESEPQNIKKLSSGYADALFLSKREVLYLLSLMALNLVPDQNHQKNHRFNRRNNFSHIFSQQIFKTKCIIEYFKVSLGQKNTNFIIQRKIQNISLEKILQKYGLGRMRSYQLCSDDESIQNFVGSAKVDFANKFLGGGALTKGCVQEQIMFANHPEMYISTILCEALQDDQSLLFVGFKKYNQHQGYSYSTKYVGKQRNLKYKLLQNNVLNQYITAIDAVQFKNNSIDQFQKKFIDRQILKAYCGFNTDDIQAIATGNWGCGAFKGNLSLKFAIQWIACSLAGKNMMYCPYGKLSELHRYKSTFKILQKKTIKQFYDFLIKYCKEIRRPEQNIFKRISNGNDNPKDECDCCQIC